MNRRNDRIHRKVAKKVRAARAAEARHRYQGQPDTSSCFLAWLNAISPTCRTKVLGVELVEREPLPEGVFERYAWEFGRPSVLDQMSLAGTATGRMGFVAPGDVVVDAGADGETGPPAVVEAVAATHVHVR